MHAVLFSVKRACQRSLALGRQLLRPLGLTPARYDLLHAIDTQYFKTIYQSDLRRILGVTAPTVSRMLKSLEDLGLIQRARPDRDTRQREVSLTEKGARCFRRATYWVIGTGAIEFALQCAIASVWYAEWALADVLRLSEDLDTMRRGLFDTATLHYPWHPDD